MSRSPYQIIVVPIRNIERRNSRLVKSTDFLVEDLAAETIMKLAEVLTLRYDIDASIPANRYYVAILK